MEEPDEGLEWLALLEEFDLPLDTLGIRVRFWQAPPGALTTEAARLQFVRGVGAHAAIHQRLVEPLATVEAELGEYLVAVYLVAAEVLDGPQAPPLWKLTSLDSPWPARWVRQTVRHANSPVALESRWRCIGQERVRILGLTETVPKREVDRAWDAFPLLREYQGIGQTEQAFRAQVRTGLNTLAQRPSNFERGMNITRIAKASGYSRGHFTTRLTDYGIDRVALTSWRPGQPLPL